MPRARIVDAEHRLLIRALPRPEQGRPGRYEAGACTTTRVQPIVDSVIMTAEGVGTISALNRTDGSYAAQGLSREAVVGVGVALTTLFAASAFYGYASAASCRQMRPVEADPYQRRAIKQTRVERQSEEAAEEAAVQARQREKAAADAKAAGEAAAAARAAPRTNP